MMWMTVDNDGTTIRGLTCTNTWSSTIHRTYYSYYSSIQPEEKVSAR
jgi:hypothetical protein